MTGKCHKIHVQFLHVNGHMRGTLCRVHQDYCTAGSGTLHQFRNIVDTAQHVGNLCHCHQLGVFRKSLVHFFLGDGAVRLAFQKDQLGTGGTGNHLPRQNIAVVFQNGNQNLVTGFQVCHAVAVRHQIHALCSISGEDNLLRTGSMNKPLHGLSGVFIAFRSFYAQGVQSAEHIGVILFIEFLHRIDHTLRLLRSRRIVKIDPIGVLEQHKVLPHVFRIPRCHVRSPPRFSDAYTLLLSRQQFPDKAFPTEPLPRSFPLRSC